MSPQRDLRVAAATPVGDNLVGFKSDSIAHPDPVANGLSAKSDSLSLGLGFAKLANHDALVAWQAERPMETFFSMSVSSPDRDNTPPPYSALLKLAKSKMAELGVRSIEVGGFSDARISFIISRRGDPPVKGDKITEGARTVGDEDPIMLNEANALTGRQPRPAPAKKRSRRGVPFTQAQVRRAVKGAESAGLCVKRVTYNPDGSITLDGKETSFVPVDRPEKGLAASWDDF